VRGRASGRAGRQPRFDMLRRSNAPRLVLERDQAPVESCEWQVGATKHFDRATNAHFWPDKPWGAIGKSLIFLNPWLSLNQRVPGSSPGAPTKQIKHLAVLISL
jgi:hypothetical protein